VTMLAKPCVSPEGRSPGPTKLLRSHVLVEVGSFYIPTWRYAVIMVIDPSRESECSGLITTVNFALTSPGN
jgi:hypothetical protein